MEAKAKTSPEIRETRAPKARLGDRIERCQNFCGRRCKKESVKIEYVENVVSYSHTRYTHAGECPTLMLENNCDKRDALVESSARITS